MKKNTVKKNTVLVKGQSVNNYHEIDKHGTSGTQGYLLRLTFMEKQIFIFFIHLLI